MSTGNSTIDFKAVNQAALSRLSELLADWLPGGHREGPEYLARNPTRGDRKPGSFSINTRTGQWSDFATGDRGGDPTSLLAYLKGTTQLDAAREVANRLGVKGSAANHNGHAARPDDDWTPLIPVPADAPKLNSEFVSRLAPAGLQFAEAYWYTDLAGELVGVVARYTGQQNGKPTKSFKPFAFCENQQQQRQWRCRGLPLPRPLYGLDLLGQRSADPVLIVEGEKTVAAAAELFNGHVATTTLNGAKSARKTDWAPLCGRDVTIWPDADVEGAAYAADVADELGKAGARSIRIVQLPPDLPDGWDLADTLPDGTTKIDLDRLVADAKLLGAAASEARPVAPAAPAYPAGYRMLDRGLVWSDPSDEDKPEIVVSGKFEVLAESRDDEGRSWGVLLRWKDPDGRAREWAMPRQMLASDGAEVRKMLLDGGLYVGAGTKARNQLTNFLTAVHVQERARAVSTTGWQGSSFVLPDGAIGKTDRERVILQTTGALDHAFNVRGDLKSWQDSVAKYAVGNSRLALALSTAFAAALVGPAGEESGGIHFRGSSSIGKTTALAVAGSVWGGESRKYVRQWRATANGLEAIATSHNDALLCLDELAQISGREAAEVGYMLANGSGKARASRDATLRRAAKWRLLFLSSGEIGLADKIAEDSRGKRQTAGQQVRVVDVPADTGSGFGLFENLHGFDSPRALAKHLVAAANASFGTAARRFIEELATDIHGLQVTVKASVSDFVDTHCPANADGQVKRVAGRFGLIAAAGEIATAIGILPWPVGEAVLAAKACFNSWIDARGGTESAEVRDGIAAVRAFLSAHGASRFLAAWDDKADETRIINLAGFRRRVDNGEGSAFDFYVAAEAWGEVCAGFDAKALAKTLAERGFLLTSGGGSHRAKVIRVPGYGSRRLYHLSSKILEDVVDA